MTSHVIAYRSLELLFGTHTFNFNCFFEDFNCVFTQIRCLSRVLCVLYCTKILHSACHNTVFSLDKSQLRKNTPCFKGIFKKWRRKKPIEIRHRSTLIACPRGFYTKLVTEIDFLHERNVR